MAKFFQRPKKKKNFFFYGGRDPGRGVSGKWSSCSPLLLIRPYDPKIFFSTSQKKKIFFSNKKKKKFFTQGHQKKNFFFSTFRQSADSRPTGADTVDLEPCAQLKKLFLWKDRALFGACITQFELGVVRDPDTRVSRVPLLYTCFLRLLQGSTGKTGVLAKNPVFQAGNRVCGLGNVPASCENHAWATHGTSCSSPP